MLTWCSVTNYIVSRVLIVVHDTGLWQWLNLWILISEFRFFFSFWKTPPPPLFVVFVKGNAKFFFISSLIIHSCHLPCSWTCSVPPHASTSASSSPSFVDCNTLHLDGWLHPIPLFIFNSCLLLLFFLTFVKFSHLVLFLSLLLSLCLPNLAALIFLKLNHFHFGTCVRWGNYRLLNRACPLKIHSFSPSSLS